MEVLGWFLVGVGGALFAHAIGFWAVRRFLRRKTSKFETFIEELKSQVPPEAQRGEKEVSELTFRDKNGVLNTVKIIVDPNIMDEWISDPPNLQELASKGQLGTLQDLMAGHKVEEDRDGTIQEFVFTPRAVQNMRAAGIEPDEVVTKMLKASGRMA